MKTLVRAFALSLVAVGAFASTHIVRNADITVASAQMNAMPVPSAPPATRTAATSATAGSRNFGNFNQQFS